MEDVHDYLVRCKHWKTNDIINTGRCDNMGCWYNNKKHQLIKSCNTNFYIDWIEFVIYRKHLIVIK